MRALAGLALAALYCGGIGVAEASPVYDGGPVPTVPVDMNFIWYGAWTGNTATAILPRLIDDLNGSTYIHTLSSFVSPATSQVPTETTNMSGNCFIDSSSSVTLWKAASLDGTVGATGAASIQSIVAAVIGTHGLTDPNALYFVLTAHLFSFPVSTRSFAGGITRPVPAVSPRHSSVSLARRPGLAAAAMSRFSVARASTAISPPMPWPA